MCHADAVWNWYWLTVLLTRWIGGRNGENVVLCGGKSGGFFFYSNFFFFHSLVAAHSTGEKIEEYLSSKLNRLTFSRFVTKTSYLHETTLSHTYENVWKKEGKKRWFRLIAERKKNRMRCHSKRNFESTFYNWLKSGSKIATNQQLTIS